MKKLFVFAALAASLLTLNGQGQRVALIIGNGNYVRGTMLNNPPNDAADMAAKLRKLGFAVTTSINTERKTLKANIDMFGDAIANADIAFFYYSGHGLQYEGENYLIPVNADVGVPGDIPEECVAVSRLLARMYEANATTNIIIFDACRKNPFKGVTRAMDQGLAPINQRPPESIIVYAAGENDVAYEGTGRNSVFTSALLTHIEQKESFADLLLDVKKEVRDSSDNKQQPADYNNLTHRIYLNGIGRETGIASSVTEPQPSANRDNLYNQGVLLEKKKDYDGAVKAYTKAANLGSPAAQFRLGLCYDLGGTSLAVNQDKADALYTMSANQGYAPSQYILAEYYLTGVSGHKKNLALGKKILNDAVSQDYAPALELLATEAQDISAEESLQLLIRAANQGYAPAQELLAQNYQFGIGVEQNLIIALFWYTLSASRPDQFNQLETSNSRDQLLQMLTQKQVSQAQQLVKDWRDNHPAIAEWEAPMLLY